AIARPFPIAQIDGRFRCSDSNRCPHNGRTLTDGQFSFHLVSTSNVGVMAVKGSRP
ncbi:hypothetical protein BgiBS90_025371, partial [Biomphalaria glabrata]